MWRFTVITLFEDIFPGPLGQSLSGKLLQKKGWHLNILNLRNFSHLKHKKVDDISFGGDFGLVIRPDIVHNALTHALTLHKKTPIIIYLSPRGSVFKQSHVKEFLQHKEIIFLCGRYEGIDDRVIEYWSNHHGLIEISLGDFILSGGEIAALAIMDTCLRYHTIERTETLQHESFENGLLEYPHYTKPREWNEIKVPEILLNGNHQAIIQWKKDMSIKITKERRPDLLKDMK